MKTLTVNRSSFIEWYYSDQSSSELRNIAWDLIKTLELTGQFKVTAKGLFKNAGYIEINLIDFEGDIELEERFREFYDEEIEDTSRIEIDGIKYKLELVE